MKRLGARSQLLIVAIGAGIVPLLAVLVALLGREDGSRLTGGWVLVAIAGAIAAIGVSWSTMRAVRLVSASMAELERSRIQFRDALRRLGVALEVSNDRAGLVDVLIDTACLITNADSATFHLAVGGHLEPRAAKGVELGSERLAVGEGVVGAAAVAGPLRWPPETDGPSPLEPAAAAALALPLTARGRVYGVLGAYREPGAAPFAAVDLDDLVAFARQAEAALDNTFLHEEARRLSLTDGLTSVWNRRQFDLRCMQEVERANRFGEPFAILILDIDDFKAVNDRFHHPGGDAVLVELAHRLIESTREVDFVGRYGGEEFVLILPRTTSEGAEVVAEHIRAAMADEPFDTGVGLAHVTVSIGIACHPEHGDSRPHLVGAADAALFEAKAAGKDVVRVASSPDPADPSTAAASAAATREVQ